MSRYLWRAAGDHENCWTPASPYHIVDEGENTSKCGAAINGVRGFVFVTKETPPLRSMTCHNCISGRVTRQ